MNQGRQKNKDTDHKEVSSIKGWFGSRISWSLEYFVLLHKTRAMVIVKLLEI